MKWFRPHKENAFQSKLDKFDRGLSAIPETEFTLSHIASLQLDLGAELYYTIRRNTEEACCIGRILRHPDEQFFPPQRHSPFWACDQRFPTKKIRGVIWFVFQPGGTHALHYGRNVWVFHEPIPDDHPVNAVPLWDHDEAILLVHMRNFQGFNRQQNHFFMKNLV